MAKLPDEARDSGLVTITIAYPDAVDVDMSCRLQDAFDLTHSIVVHDDVRPGPAGVGWPRPSPIC